MHKITVYCCWGPAMNLRSAQKHVQMNIRNPYKAHIPMTPFGLRVHAYLSSDASESSSCRAAQKASRTCLIPVRSSMCPGKIPHLHGRNCLLDLPSGELELQNLLYCEIHCRTPQYEFYSWKGSAKIVFLRMQARNCKPVDW